MTRTLAGLLTALVLALPARAADEKDTGFVKLFDGKTLKGWKSYPEGTGQWKVEDGAIVGTGKASHLFTERGDYADFHLRAEVSINEGGNSGMYFRTKFGPGFPDGYEAQINSTHRDPVKTGSLYPSKFKFTAEQRKKMIVNDKLHQPDEWFVYEVIAKGPHVIIKVNGKETVNMEEGSKTFTKGHFAFQQHHEGSVVRIRKVEVKELTDK